MYYKMSGDMGGEPNVRIRKLNNESAMVRSGRYISDLTNAYIMELPFRFDIRIRRDDDEVRQAPRFMAYYGGTQLMHKRLLSSLQQLGVDNLQSFAAVLSEDGVDLPSQDYVVVNVVGAVACASLPDSDAIPFTDRYFFNDLVIDLSKARDLLMFRLADSLLDILVHESIAKTIMMENFPYLELTALKSV